VRRVVAVALVAAACRPGAPASVTPAPTPNWDALTRLVDSAVADGAAPGAVVGVSLRGVRLIHGTGRLGVDDGTNPGPETLYDLASLTKVVALTTALMLAVDDGRIGLDEPVQRYVPGFRGPGTGRVTIRHLLTHSAGLPAHRSLWRETTHWLEAHALVDATPLDTVPGARSVYSDLGAIVLTHALEAAVGEPLDAYVEARIFRPLGMRSTRYLPPPEWLPRIAPTERDPWRGRVLRGEVHDENAWWLGGVSGHAGLFGTAADLLTFGEWLLSGARRTKTAKRARPGAGTPAPPRSLEEFVRRQDVVSGSSRALGWDTPSLGSSAGTRLSARSFGHTGFTGTSIWVDPERDLVVVLLSNRVHPSRDNPRLARLRPLVADAAAAVADEMDVRRWSLVVPPTTPTTKDERPTTIDPTD